MSHFAQLDENNTVLQVIVVNNTELAVYSTVTNNGYIEEIQTLSELKGIEFCQSLYGPDTNWRQTSYNSKFRGKYAAIGDVYDSVADVFRDPNAVEVVPEAVVEAVAPVIETQQTAVMQSADIPAITSADIPALTSEQISGLE
jgi:hypothetical protein